MKQVKVVKRGERSRQAAAQAEAGGTSKGEAANAREREAAAVISRWVSELRHKQRAESQRMLANLFGLPATARP